MGNMGSDTDNDVDFSATSDQCDTDNDVDFSATSDECDTDDDVDFSATSDQCDTDNDDIDFRSLAKNHVTNVIPRLYQR